jgi:TRAP-type C4-dicarboxylate transport system substrate-binding protein
MFKYLLRCAIIASALVPVAGAAAPITLKFAYFSSDRSMSYRAGIKPFIDAVNADAKGLMEVVLHSGGVLGRERAKQPQLVLDGTADIAFVPGNNPERFPDNALFTLPGLFRDSREATLVFNKLIASNALKGYEDFVVIGAYVTEPATIHSRLPINAIADLKGKRIRVNHVGEAAALEKLGAVPVLMEINRVSDAMSSGSIDAAVVSRTPLYDYGIKRVAANHYFLGTSGGTLAIVMNRKRFEELPPPAQDIIRKYSGEWAAARFIETIEVSAEQVMQQLKSDPQRRIVFPSQPDLDRAQVAFKSVIEEWAEISPRNRELLNGANAEIAKLRSTRQGSNAVTR